jgi:arylsulfatase A-like enzyme
MKNGYRLGDDARTLAEILTAAGYETAAFVSGFTLNGKFTGLDRGFQTYDDGGEGQRDRRGENTLKAALAWLRQRPKDNPIFLFFHLYDPHFSYRAPPPHSEGFRDPAKTDWQFPAYPNIKRLRSQGFEPGEAEEFVARYDGEIHYADMVVGRLLDVLDASDIGKKSLVILTSDHGETLIERPYPLAHGARTFDEQIRIPLAIRFPEGRGKGRRIQSGAHHVDMAPTVLDFLGLKGPPSHGLSLLGAVDGKPPANPRPLFSMARPEPARVANLREPMGRKGFVESVRIGGLKLISYPTATGTTVQLFDLTKDPQEKKDISIQSPDLVSRLEKELDAWRTSSGGTVDPPSPTLSDDTRDALRALGYLE